ncbi:MAG: hypothetical protein GY828_02270 [Candidatus Gracilibacteria bacterium]|nr:hypothetical protein [Candidatus Gracilibacteria bacterium]
MFDFKFDGIINSIYSSISTNIEYFAPKIIWALLLLGFGAIIAVLTYRFVLYAFKKFKLLDLIDKLTIDFEDIAHVPDHKTDEEKIKSQTKRFSQRVKVDIIIGKALGYYIFLVFFRFAIVAIGIDEVEKFLADLLKYLPSIFIAIIIGFFGVRFSNFIYDVIFQTLNLTKQKTAKIIAAGARIIVLFFTLMAVLDKIGIASDIIQIILTGFVAMLTIAGGIAFGLGGKDVAREILESFRK